jgi:hypothetical protein
MRARRTAAIITAGLLALGGVAGCGEDDVEDAARDAGNTAEDAANDAGEAAEDAAGEVEDEAGEAADDVQNEVEE